MNFVKKLSECFFPPDVEQAMGNTGLCQRARNTCRTISTNPTCRKVARYVCFGGGVLLMTITPQLGYETNKHIFNTFSTCSSDGLYQCATHMGGVAARTFASIAAPVAGAVLFWVGLGGKIKFD